MARLPRTDPRGRRARRPDGLRGLALNQVLNFTHDVAFNTLGGLLQPLGSWTIALIPMLGGIVVAVILRLLARPDALTGMAHIIERVTRSNGRLDAM